MNSNIHKALTSKQQWERQGGNCRRLYILAIGLPENFLPVPKIFFIEKRRQYGNFHLNFRKSGWTKSKVAFESILKCIFFVYADEMQCHALSKFQIIFF